MELDRVPLTKKKNKKIKMSTIFEGANLLINETDIPNFINGIKDLYLEAREKRSQAISTLRNLSKTDALESKKLNDFNRFKDRSDVIKSDLESNVENSLDVIKNAVREIKILFADIKDQEFRYSGILNYLYDNNKISNKDYREATTYLQFLNDNLNFIESKIPVFKDGRLGDLDTRYTDGFDSINKWMEEIEFTYQLMVYEATFFKNHKDEYVYASKMRNVDVDIATLYQDNQINIKNYYLSLKSELESLITGGTDVESNGQKLEIVNAAISYITEEISELDLEYDQKFTEWQQYQAYYNEKFNSFSNAYDYLNNKILNLMGDIDDIAFFQYQKLYKNEWLYYMQYKNGKLDSLMGYDGEVSNAFEEYRNSWYNTYSIGNDINSLNDSNTIWKVKDLAGQIKAFIDNAQLQGRYGELVSRLRAAHISKSVRESAILEANATNNSLFSDMQEKLNQMSIINPATCSTFEDFLYALSSKRAEFESLLHNFRESSWDIYAQTYHRDAADSYIGDLRTSISNIANIINNSYANIESSYVDYVYYQSAALNLGTSESAIVHKIDPLNTALNFGPHNAYYEEFERASMWTALSRSYWGSGQGNVYRQLINNPDYSYKTPTVVNI